MPTLQPVAAGDIAEVTTFLREADLTVSGLGAQGFSLWVERNSSGAITATTGFELSDDGEHALIRSVAVDSSLRGSGRGRELARFALSAASDRGARHAWLFSRRSGPFWRQLGFVHADRYELARRMPETHQVRMFVASGQLEIEQAWCRPLDDRLHDL